jgi:hypothetical protein
MNDLESLPNPEEIEAFLKGKPVSAEFIAQLEEHTKALIEKFEASTKSLSRSGADLLPQTEQTI